MMEVTYKIQKHLFSSNVLLSNLFSGLNQCYYRTIYFLQVTWLTSNRTLEFTTRRPRGAIVVRIRGKRKAIIEERRETT